MKRPKIAITMGDFNGIGPEVTIKALSDETIRGRCQPVIIGSYQIIKQINKSLGGRLKLSRLFEMEGVFLPPEVVGVLDCVRVDPREVTLGRVSRAAGETAGRCLDEAIVRALMGDVDGVVTAPVCKQALKLAGYHYPGQTELLAEKTGTKRFAMMLVAGTFRIGLATTHCPISQVPRLLKVKKITEKIQVIHNALKERFGIKEPRIALCALNPHGGEGGLFGSEETRVIRPAVERAQGMGMDVQGPFPSDSLFARVDEGGYHAYLAMYHDQGMIPIKLRAFGRAVNFTAGLPIIRTSPDHGTAFDIAGKFIADEGSMKEAIRLAIEISVQSS